MEELDTQVARAAIKSANLRRPRCDKAKAAVAYDDRSGCRHCQIYGDSTNRRAAELRRQCARTIDFSEFATQRRKQSLLKQTTRKVQATVTSNQGQLRYRRKRLRPLTARLIPAAMP